MPTLTRCYLELGLQTGLALPAEAQPPTPVSCPQAFLHAPKLMLLEMQLVLTVQHFDLM